jgi:hypothetical protein
VIAIARRQTRDRLRGRRLQVADDSFLADQPGSSPGPEATALDRGLTPACHGPDAATDTASSPGGTSAGRLGRARL